MRNDTNYSKVVLSTGQWLSLLGTVGTLITAGVWGAHSIESRLTEAMVDLDRRWQARSEIMVRDLRSDMKAVEKSIHRLESEFTRDFMRKTELDQLLKHRTNDRSK